MPRSAVNSTTHLGPFTVVSRAANIVLNLVVNCMLT